MNRTATAAKAASRLDLSATEARRIALMASFGSEPFHDAPSALTHLGLLQLDPMARVAKAHRLTCLSRMSPTASPEQIDPSLWTVGPAVAFETWAHAVCLIPVEDWPLMRLARERALESPKRPAEQTLNDVRAIVAGTADGATISEIEDPARRARGWDWSERKRATEHMLRSGELVCTARRGAKRVFDVPERRIPHHLLQTHLTREEIFAGMARNALDALGVATTADIATYYNLSIPAAHEGLEVLGASTVSVEGWTTPAWAVATAMNGAAPDRDEPVLVGPFDNLIWDRQRTLRVFEFDYTLESYKPAAKRKYGYYVLAVVVDGQIVGRADMRRVENSVEVLAAYPEPSVDASYFNASLEIARTRLSQQLQARR